MSTNNTIHVELEDETYFMTHKIYDEDIVGKLCFHFLMVFTPEDGFKISVYKNDYTVKEMHAGNLATQFANKQGVDFGDRDDEPDEEAIAEELTSLEQDPSPNGDQDDPRMG